MVTLKTSLNLGLLFSDALHVILSIICLFKLNMNITNIVHKLKLYEINL